jgi:hypothetical protein
MIAFQPNKTLAKQLVTYKPEWCFSKTNRNGLCTEMRNLFPKSKKLFNGSVDNHYGADHNQCGIFIF